MTIDSLVRAYITAALATTAMVGCGHNRPTAEPWFAERGKTSDTWHTCVRIGAALRAACSGDAGCEARVTTDVTRPCYVARYRAETAPVTPTHDSPPESLSPCFWDYVEPRPESPDAYARAQCASLALSPELAPHCAAELHAVIDGLCTEGSTDLTGAGP